MITRAVLVVALAAAVHSASVDQPAVAPARDGKLFPVLQIVTFPNDGCTADSGETGTCYSEDECANHNGLASGTCAKGFGKCCVLSATCGGVLSNNGSYFTNPGFPASYSTPGMCMVELDPPEGTCQILLEFESFNIMGPVEGECNNDTFVVMGANSGSRIPVLCGENNAQHMYIDVDNSEGPYKLVVTSSAATFGRNWKIKVTYLGEDDPCKAPPRCLQYHKEKSGMFSSFNYGSTPMMLTNQAYSMCFAYVPGYCDIGLNFDRLDLGAINNDCENDYLAIWGTQHCGDVAGYTAQANATGPAVIGVLSDSDNEREEEGFKGTYMMMAC